MASSCYDVDSHVTVVAHDVRGCKRPASSTPDVTPPSQILKSGRRSGGRSHVQETMAAKPVICIRSRAFPANVASERAADVWRVDPLVDPMMKRRVSVEPFNISTPGFSSRPLNFRDLPWPTRGGGAGSSNDELIRDRMDRAMGWRTGSLGRARGAPQSV